MEIRSCSSWLVRNAEDETWGTGNRNLVYASALTLPPAALADRANRMRAGVVWANTFNRFDPASPFGGYRESGFGREGGVHGLGPYVSLS